MRILRIQEVTHTTGLSTSSVYKQIRLGEFPPSVKITKRASGWDAEAVHAWVAAKLGKKVEEEDTHEL
jgi:prophage regulatory protein